MNRMAAAALVIAVSVSSCAARIPAPPVRPVVGKIKIVIDSEFGALGVEAILSAISRWHEASGACFDIAVKDVSKDETTWADDGVSTIYLARSGWKKHAFDILRGDNSYIGLTILNTRDIFLADQYHSLRQVAMHETGHSLGIVAHSPNRLSTMYYLALSGGIQDVTRDDARAVYNLIPNHRCR